MCAVRSDIGRQDLEDLKDLAETLETPRLVQGKRTVIPETTFRISPLQSPCKHVQRKATVCACVNEFFQTIYRATLADTAPAGGALTKKRDGKRFETNGLIHITWMSETLSQTAHRVMRVKAALIGGAWMMATSGHPL